MIVGGGGVERRTGNRLCAAAGQREELGLPPLPKSGSLDHIRDNAAVDFEISDADMEALNNVDRIREYGDARVFPVHPG